jgi:hypothetical protein
MTTAVAFEKTITPETDRSGRHPRTEYKAELDGQLIGYHKTINGAETALNKLILELIQSGATRTATELDDSSDVEEIAADMAGAEAEYIAHYERPDDQEQDPDYLDFVRGSADVNWNSAPGDGPCMCDVVVVAGHAANPDDIIDPRDGPCAACDGPHHIQRCGELLARLFAPERTLVRHSLAQLEHRIALAQTAPNLLCDCRVALVACAEELWRVGAYKHAHQAELALAGCGWEHGDMGCPARAMEEPWGVEPGPPVETMAV